MLSGMCICVWRPFVHKPSLCVCMYACIHTYIRACINFVASKDKFTARSAFLHACMSYHQKENMLKVLSMARIVTYSPRDCHATESIVHMHACMYVCMYARNRKQSRYSSHNQLTWIYICVDADGGAGVLTSKFGFERSSTRII